MWQPDNMPRNHSIRRSSSIVIDLVDLSKYFINLIAEGTIVEFWESCTHYPKLKIFKSIFTWRLKSICIWQMFSTRKWYSSINRKPVKVKLWIQTLHRETTPPMLIMRKFRKFLRWDPLIFSDYFSTCGQQWSDIHSAGTLCGTWS